MAAYFIAQYVVNDSKLYREYQAAAAPTIQAAGGEVVAFDVAAETIEGTPPGPQTVILKFESTEAAKAWYQSPAYQAVVGKRLAATKGFAIIAQSMNLRGCSFRQAPARRSARNLTAPRVCDARSPPIRTTEPVVAEPLKRCTRGYWIGARATPCRTRRPRAAERT